MKQADEIYIFLGPSLSLKEAQKILPEAHFLPPARQGDILSLATQKFPKAIGLIDGFFRQELSVWHKEILFALHQNILVAGASSMGALRAAELADCGMVGIGKVFELYRSGVVNDDDEVALIHGPAEGDFFPLSLPLINLRCTLELARENFSPQECEDFFKLVQSLYYPERTWEKITSMASEKGFSSLANFIKEHYIDQKQEDARLLLQQISLLKNPSQKEDFPRTALFEILYHYDKHLDLTTGLSSRQLAHYVALHHPQFSELQFHALNQVLASFLAQLLKIKINSEDLEEEKKRFCLRHKLFTPEEFSQWLTKNDLNEEEFHALLDDRAKTRILQRSFSVGQLPWKKIKFLLEELKWNNSYEEWKEKALCQEQFLQEVTPYYEQTSQEELYSEQLIEDHLKQTLWSPDLPYPTWSEEAGFQSLSELKSEMLRSKIARDYLKNLSLGFSLCELEDFTL